MANYNFVTIWKLNAPLERVWAEIEETDQWPEWWKGVVEVAELEKGDRFGLGSVRRFTFKSALPYSLSFQSKVVAVEMHKRIEGIAFGELDGVGVWHFTADAQHTIVKYNWTVKTNKWWMNLLSPMARPVFEWNHDVIMKWGGLGLAQRLGCSLVA